MAHKGKIIVNHVTGEQFEFLETANDSHGQRLRFRFKVAPKGKLPVVHFHPQQTEKFEMISGRFCVLLNHKENIELGPEESLLIEKNLPHVWWNPSENDYAEMVVTFEPALNTEVFFEQWCGLCNAGKLNKHSQLKFFQIMVMMNTYQLYISGLPLGVQKVMGAIFGTVAKLFGYRSYYPEYSL